MSYPGKIGALRLRADNEFGERSPGEIRWGYSLADIATGFSYPARSVVSDKGRPVTRHAENPAPTMRDLDVIENGKYVHKGFVD